MCLLIFAHQVHPQIPLAIAANRDEFHDRPTSASAFWRSDQNLLAGRDEELGGTWMGITRSGRFAAVTNFRDPERTAPAPRSRGELPLHFLQSEDSPQQYLAALADKADAYAGFNLLVGNADELWYLSNATQAAAQKLAPGIYGLSNAQLDSPWPKSELGKERLAATLNNGPLSHDELAAVVSNRELADTDVLLARSLATEMDRLLSAQFITGEVYGTRSTTSLWITAERHIHWREHSFNAAGETTRCVEESFSVTPQDCI